jgi:hypothetical protein
MAKSMPWLNTCLLTALLLLTCASTFGCSDGRQSTSGHKYQHRIDTAVFDHASANEGMGRFDGHRSKLAIVPGEKDLDKQSAAVEIGDAAANRKIIYTANLAVVVEDFAEVPHVVQSLVDRHGGFVAQSNVGSMQGRSRSGSWTIRIPVDQYQSFLAASGEIGQTESLSQDADDVSEEFFDAEARVKNKKKLEARIVKLLDKSDHKIQHVIEVERELGRVRQEIECIEGRIRYLTDRTSLTTINLSIREQRNYVPETAPTFANRISGAWTASINRFQLSAENFVVFAVGNFLGFCFFVTIAVACLFLLQRFVAPNFAKS